MHDESGSASPPNGHQACVGTQKSPTMVTPATGWVEGHTGAERVLRMTCSKRVVKPVCAVTSRIWRVRGELRACRGRVQRSRISSTELILAKKNDKCERNHLIAPSRRPFGFSHRSCDEVYKWAVPPAGLRQASRGQTGYQRGAAGTSAVGGRPVGGGGGRPAGRPAGGGHHAKRWTRCGFSFKAV